MTSFSLTKKIRTQDDPLHWLPDVYLDLLKAYCTDLLTNKPYMLIELYINERELPKFPIMSMTTQVFEANINRLTEFYTAWKEHSLNEYAQWQYRCFQKWGNQRYPKELSFENFETLFQLTGLLPAVAQVLDKYKALILLNERLSLLPKKCGQWFVKASMNDINHLTNTVIWFLDNPNSGLYMRQVDVEGVHTKWIEQNITPLFTALKLINHDDTELSFEAYTGLVTPPATVRFRLIGSELDDFFHGATDIMMPVKDLNIIGSKLGPLCSTIVILENEKPGLYFDNIKQGMCIFGLGNAVTMLEHVDFIRRCPNILYIGDLDIEGLYILNRLRKRIPQVKSRYMDKQTLIEYDASAVNYTPKYTNESLDGLTDSERKLFDYLSEIQGTDSNNRLEHEFIKLADMLQ
ncbi:Wadjet anti-phage system protein JetD domain-containing protein [Photobacterium kasasachensis]|uniref:Wadjet anti-phage system protein JetD domain-containing protein n=1 Tax=Photobacterium kasasachensis TaxID=2910240 RepID=UPI003D0C8D8D